MCNATNETRTANCPKCDGIGTLSWASHIDAGRCFACKGTGTITINLTKAASEIPAEMTEKCEWILNTEKDGSTLSWAQLQRLHRFAHNYVMNKACRDYYGDTVLEAFNTKLAPAFFARQRQQLDG